MKRLAYLVNQYPAISHTFVRREILALEELGYEVARFSIRAPRDAVITQADLEETEKTVVLLRWGQCIMACIAIALTRPGALLSAITMLVKLCRTAGGGIVRHAAYFLEAANLTQSLRQLKIQHLHVHFGTNPAAVALLARKLGGPPFSFTVHGPEEFDRPVSEALGLKIAHARFVVAISSFGRSQLQRWCPFEHWKKIHIVHCGLDRSFIEREATPVPDTHTFVCVGRLSEQKGHFVLLQAAKQLAEKTRDFRVVLVGDGDFRPALEAEVAAAGLQSQIEFAGWQTEAEVQQWLENCRAMVLPSFAEGLPVVIMEALGMGRPVITTYVAGIPELVENCKNGWLVPAADVTQLADAMKQSLDTPVQQLTQMGTHGQQAVQRQHSVTREVAVLARAIERE